MYPLSNCIPSVNSSSMPKVFDSSTVITPSLPTLSRASAIVVPISVSAAEIAAICAISSFDSISLDSFLIASTAASTAFSIPRLRAIGLAPAATFFIPPLTMARASTVAVVVPSPATSFVLVATSLVVWAPMFSHGSSSSMSLAIVTPSLVIVGAPHFLSSTTFWPLGPSVMATASASLSTPASRPRRASSPNFSNFEAKAGLLTRYALGERLLLERGEHVTGRQDQVLLAVDLDLGAAVLRVDHDVADLHVERDAAVAVLVPPAWAGGDDGALLGLLLGGVGDHEASRGGLVTLVRLHDDPVLERLELEVRHLLGPSFCWGPTGCPGR